MRNKCQKSTRCRKWFRKLSNTDLGGSENCGREARPPWLVRNNLDTRAKCPHRIARNIVGVGLGHCFFFYATPPFLAKMGGGEFFSQNRRGGEKWGGEKVFGLLVVPKMGIEEKN